MNALEIRRIQLEKDFIPYNMELVEDEEVSIVLSIYYGYYNQFLEYYGLWRLDYCEKRKLYA